MSIWKRDIAKTTKAKGLLSLKFSSLWMTFWPISGISTRASVCVWAKEQAKSFHKIPPALRFCLTAGGLRRCNVCFHHSGESSFVFGFGRKWAKITPPAAQFFSLEVTDTFSLTTCACTPPCWFLFFAQNFLKIRFVLHRNRIFLGRKSSRPISQILSFWSGWRCL